MMMKISIVIIIIIVDGSFFHIFNGHNDNDANHQYTDGPNNVTLVGWWNEENEENDLCVFYQADRTYT